MPKNNSPNGKAQKGSGAPSSPKSVADVDNLTTTGSFNKDPILLKYSSNSGSPNLEEWRKCTEMLLRAEYNDCGTFLKEGVTELWVPVKPTAPTTTDKDDPDYVAYLEDIKLWARKKALTVEHYKSIHGKMKLWMSAESRHQAATHVDWDATDLEANPFKLWGIIKATHVTACGTALTNSFARAELEEQYGKFRQGAHEAVFDYFERFRRMQARRELVGIDLPDEPTQAREFIFKLDRGRFAELISRIRNDLLLSPGTATAYSTLAGALQIASAYTVTTSASGNITNAATVYTTTQTPKKKDSDTDKSNKKSDKPKPKDNDSSTSPKKSNKSNGDGSKNKNNKSMLCSLCDSPEHLHRDCPHLAFAKAAVETKKEAVHITHRATVTTRTVNSLACVYEKICVNASNTTYDDANVVYIDNAATEALFNNPKLLSNLCESELVEFTGISKNGSSVLSTVCGTFADAIDVQYSKDASVNIIGFAQVVDIINDNPDNGMRIGYRELPYDDYFLLAPDGTQYVFTRMGRMYGCHINPNTGKPSQQHIACATLVSDNETLYNKRQVELAKEVEEFERRVGYTNPSTLIELSKSITNCPFTMHDIKRAHDIYGVSEAYHKGKMKHKTHLPIDYDRLPDVVHPPLVMEADVMFVEGTPFLISVTSPLDMTLCTHLGYEKGARSGTNVTAILKEHILTYTARNFRVTEVHCDNDGSIKAAAPMLAEYKSVLKSHAAGDKCNKVERKIQTIKSIVRSITASLAWRMALTFLVACVLFATCSVNRVPTKGGYMGVSPFEAFEGRRLDFKRDFRAAFGDIVIAKDPHVTSNSNAPRADVCVMAYPANDDQGSVWVIKLSNFKKVLRHQIEIIPTTQAHIDTLNLFYDFTKSKVTSDPVFIQGESIVHNIIDAEDVDALGDVQPSDLIQVVEADRAVPTHDIIISNVDTLTPAVHNDDVIAGVHEDIPDTHYDNDVVYSAPSEDPIVPMDTHIDIPDNPNLNPNYESRFSPNPNDANVIEAIKEDVQLPAMRYNLRPRTTTGVRDGAWNNRNTNERTYDLRPRNRKASIQHIVSRSTRHEYVFQTSLKRALKKMTRPTLVAAYKEMHSIITKGTFHPIIPHKISRRRLRQSIMSMMFLKDKYLADGTFDKLKARLVAGGHQQDRTLYDDISSPTATLSSLLMIACIAAKEGRKVYTADIGTAYLNATMTGNKPIMKLDPTVATICCSVDPTYNKYLQPDGSIYVELDKALYGCIESAKLWYDTLSADLIKLGFITNKCDPCVFNKDVDGKQLTVKSPKVDHLRCGNIPNVDDFSSTDPL